MGLSVTTSLFLVSGKSMKTITITDLGEGEAFRYRLLLIDENGVEMPMNFSTDSERAAWDRAEWLKNKFPKDEFNIVRD